MARRFDSVWRVRHRLTELGGKGPARPSSARAHLIALKVAMGMMDDDAILRHWYARDLEDEVTCIVCELECMDPIQVSSLPECQQIVWDALHVKYTATVARHFFIRSTEVIPHDDTDAWLMKLRRLI